MDDNKIVAIIAIINEYESSDKSEFIQDLLIKLGPDECDDILSHLEDGRNILDGDWSSNVNWGCLLVEWPQLTCK